MVCAAAARGASGRSLALTRDTRAMLVEARREGSWAYAQTGQQNKNISINKPGGHLLSTGQQAARWGLLVVQVEGRWFARRPVVCDSAFPFLRAEPKLEGPTIHRVDGSRRLTRWCSRQNGDPRSADAVPRGRARSRVGLRRGRLAGYSCGGEPLADARVWSVGDPRGVDDHFVGVVELHFAGEGIEGIAPSEVEAGWWVTQGRRNQGIATTAMQAAIGDLWSRAGFDSIAAYIAGENEPSAPCCCEARICCARPGSRSLCGADDRVRASPLCLTTGLGLALRAAQCCFREESDSATQADLAPCVRAASGRYAQVRRDDLMRSPAVRRAARWPGHRLFLLVGHDEQ